MSRPTMDDDADDIDLEFCIDCGETFDYDDCGGYNPSCQCGAHCRSCYEREIVDPDDCCAFDDDDDDVVPRAPDVGGGT